MKPVLRSRRDFLRDTGLAAAGLSVAVHLPGCAGVPSRGAVGDWTANAVLRITPDDRIIFTLARVEMGQGTLTSETMLVAEELNVSPSEIEIEHAPAHSAYVNPDYGIQTTGGSNSTRSSFEPLRKAGAAVREALIGAAAERWQAPRGEVTLQGKALVHGPTKRRLSIGAVVDSARKHLGEAEPKPRDQWTLLGKDQPRLDAKSKSDGSAVFSADIAPKGLEVALVVRGPFGAQLLSFDAAEAKQIAGVKAVFEIPSGVAVVADRYYRALKATRVLKTEWSPSDVSTEGLFEEYEAKLKEGPGSEVRDQGDVDAAFSAGGTTLDAQYSLPFLAHATMEPPTATAWVQADRTEIWAPTQSPTLCRNQAAHITGHDQDAVLVHQTLIGGGFGRKALSDFVVEAVHISKQRKAPVRLLWSRENDVQHDIYRPASLHQVKAVLQAGTPVAWAHRMAGQSSIFDTSEPMLEEIVPGFMTGAVQWGADTFADDNSIVEGAKELAYGIDSIQVSYHRTFSPVICGIWRSVGYSANGFVTECFIDELAHAAKADPAEFRRKLLTRHPRHLRTLDAVVKASSWHTAAPKGRARGIAVHESFGSVVAQVAEISIENNRPRVHKVWAAVECGLAINPDGIRAQIEGGIVFGLSTAVADQEITIKEGRVQQSNFHDFRVLRMNECPEIDVEIIASDAAPTGVGEPGVPPIAPAVANAVFALTGQRLRALPLRLAYKLEAHHHSTAG